MYNSSLEQFEILPIFTQLSSLFNNGENLFSSVLCFDKPLGILGVVLVSSGLVYMAKNEPYDIEAMYYVFSIDTIAASSRKFRLDVIKEHLYTSPYRLGGFLDHFYPKHKRGIKVYLRYEFDDEFVVSLKNPSIIKLNHEFFCPDSLDFIMFPNTIVLCTEALPLPLKAVLPPRYMSEADFKALIKSWKTSN
jgi:hypothetical protein